MDLGQIGEHCSLPGCRQLDFLPFRCSSCAKVLSWSLLRLDSAGAFTDHVPAVGSAHLDLLLVAQLV